MYASNEDEYDREDSDWILLRQTPPINTILHGAVNLVDHEPLNAPSSSSSNSSSSKSERTDSVSSLSSTEHDHVEQENHLLNEEPVLPSQNNDDNNDLLFTGEIKEEVLSSEMMIKQDNETTPVINEYDLFNGGFDLSNEPIPPGNNIRRRTGENVQQIVERYSLEAEHERSPPMMRYLHPRRANAYFVCILVIILFTSQLAFIRFISKQRVAMDRVKEELYKANQRLDEIKPISSEEIEQKLTKQFEQKFQKIMNDKMFEYNQEIYSLVLQISELYEIINHTKQNLTNTIHQLSNENERLNEQFIALEHRLQITEERASKEKETCPEGVDGKKSSTSSLDVLLGNLIKQTASIAEDTSLNLSGLFEQLSASISDLVDHRHEYVEGSKRKLTDLGGLQAAEQVQQTIRRGVDNLTSSLRNAQSTYTAWLRSRAEYRERARKTNIEEEKTTNRRPWRWTFQRSQDRERMRHDIPITKKHSFYKESVCHSQYEFPVNQLCSMKNWMEKFFGP